MKELRKSVNVNVILVRKTCFNLLRSVNYLAKICTRDDPKSHPGLLQMLNISKARKYSKRLHNYRRIKIIYA